MSFLRARAVKFPICISVSVLWFICCFALNPTRVELICFSEDCCLWWWIYFLSSLFNLILIFLKKNIHCILGKVEGHFTMVYVCKSVIRTLWEKYTKKKDLNLLLVVDGKARRPWTLDWDFLRQRCVAWEYDYDYFHF